jgi:hypothetical protein
MSYVVIKADVSNVPGRWDTGVPGAPHSGHIHAYTHTHARTTRTHMHTHTHTHEHTHQHTHTHIGKYMSMLWHTA